MSQRENFLHKVLLQTKKRYQLKAQAHSAADSHKLKTTLKNPFLYKQNPNRRMPYICRKSPIINANAQAEMRRFLLRTSLRNEATKFICALLHAFCMVFAVYDFFQVHDFFSRFIHWVEDQSSDNTKGETLMTVMLFFCLFHYGFFWSLFTEQYVPMCLYYAWYTLFVALTMHYVALYNCWLGLLIIAHYISIFFYLSDLVAILRNNGEDNQVEVV